MVGPRGLEPLTFAMSTQRSNQLSYEPVYYGQEGSRTLTTLRPTDFKSVVYAIPPLARTLIYLDTTLASVSNKFFLSKNLLEATSGFEPLYSSFAESCLTTWLRRQNLLCLFNNIFDFCQTAHTCVRASQLSLYRTNKPISQRF